MGLDLGGATENARGFPAFSVPPWPSHFHQGLWHRFPRPLVCHWYRDAFNLPMFTYGSPKL
ncbi:hypothetical protein GCM10011410_24440 [Hoyosella rhizosphaerae]|uniref:Uncharacterized protein n=1 Tax=Hoyosella rhizosphaerae TaxID=1755582 RepID=A0A916UES0_9ACTN|nr:hypothetical protein GCM10011410_24440 [Hoyosella rhizosphaerae]